MSFDLFVYESDAPLSAMRAARALERFAHTGSLPPSMTAAHSGSAPTPAVLAAQELHGRFRGELGGGLVDATSRSDARAFVLNLAFSRVQAIASEVLACCLGAGLGVYDPQGDLAYAPNPGGVTPTLSSPRMLADAPGHAPVIVDLVERLGDGQAEPFCVLEYASGAYMQTCTNTPGAFVLEHRLATGGHFNIPGETDLDTATNALVAFAEGRDDWTTLAWAPLSL